jgi:hypothetical protein
MPCWDSLLYTKASTPYGNAKPQEESPEIKHLESRIHKLTEMLCELCSRVEAGWPSVFVENTELSAWWKSHKADDQVIEELEKVRSLKKQLDDLEQRISNRFAK